MDGLLWIAQLILAVTFLVTGSGKLFAYDRMMGVVGLRLKTPAGISRAFAALIGIAELAGAIGIIFPRAFLPAELAQGHLLTRLAAADLALIMVGAGIYHLRRNEEAAPSVALFLLALLVLYERWPR